MNFKTAFILLAIPLLALACSSDSPAQTSPPIVNTPESLSPTDEIMPTETVQLEPALDPSEKVFRVVVIVDTSSEDVGREQAAVLIADASAIHERLSGFRVEMIDFVSAEAEITGTGDDEFRNLEALIFGYELEHSILPDGFIIFSYGHWGEARLYGGYTYLLDAPEGYTYRFKATVSDIPSYHIGVVQFGHRYAICGYGADSTLENPIQDHSSNGECSNTDGVACEENNGYSMCSDATEDLYASTPTYFAAASVVHETMHNFGVEVAIDHYGTQACTDAMAANGSTREYDPDDDVMIFEYAGICPFIYDNFVDSFLFADG
jgi:hypothetical protein